MIGLLLPPGTGRFPAPAKTHDSRDWFARNKQRYEKAVRDPALLFIASFAP